MKTYAYTYTQHGKTRTNTAKAKNVGDLFKSTSTCIRDSITSVREVRPANDTGERLFPILLPTVYIAESELNKLIETAFGNSGWRPLGAKASKTAEALMNDERVEIHTQGNEEGLSLTLDALLDAVGEQLISDSLRYQYLHRQDLREYLVENAPPEEYHELLEDATGRCFQHGKAEG